MHKTYAIPLAALGAFVLLVTAAGAASSTLILKDATGDATGGAADIDTITLSNADDGTIAATWVFADRPALTSDDIAVLLVDSDASSSTGDTGWGAAGFDYQINVASGPRAVIGRWTGSDWVQADAPTLRPGDGTSFSIHRDDLGGTTQMVVGSFTTRFSSEEAFDGSPIGTLFVLLAPKIVSTSLVVKPAVARAGRVVSATVSLTLEDRQTVKPTTFRCRATLAGKTLRPVRQCTWRLPASAKRKRLVISASGDYHGVPFKTAARSLRVR